MMKRASSNKIVGRRGIGDIFNTLFYSKKSLLMVLMMVGLLISLLPIHVLEASDQKAGEHLKSWRVKKGDMFGVEYTHSVELTPVIENYRINEKYHIILEETYFHSYGAGLPATTPYEFEMTENGFRIYGIAQEMDSVVYRTGAVRANHQLKIGNDIYPFLDFSKPRTAVRFAIRKLFFLQYLVKEVLS